MCRQRLIRRKSHHVCSNQQASEVCTEVDICSLPLLNISRALLILLPESPCLLVSLSISWSSFYPPLMYLHIRWMGRSGDTPRVPKEQSQEGRPSLLYLIYVTCAAPDVVHTCLFFPREFWMVVNLKSGGGWWGDVGVWSAPQLNISTISSELHVLLCTILSSMYYMYYYVLFMIHNWIVCSVPQLNISTITSALHALLCTNVLLCTIMYYYVLFVIQHY